MFKLRKGIDDATYFSLGDIFKDEFKSPIDLHGELVVSNSFLGQAFKRGLYNVLQDHEQKISDELMEIFNLGSAFHCYVLEHEDFYERYYVKDIIDENKERLGLKRVSPSEFLFIEICYKKILRMYPQVINNDLNEVVITGVIDGVPVKCKIDCLIITDTEVQIIDLKGVWYKFFSKYISANGDRVGLRKSLCDNNYDLQSYFYSKMVSELLRQKGIYLQPSFSLLVCSKDDKSHDVQMFRVGSEMDATGEQKYSSVWQDVVDFYEDGKTNVRNYITL